MNPTRAHVHDLSPAALAHNPLFAPYAPQLKRLRPPEASRPEELDELLSEHIVSGGGARIRFVAPRRDGLDYEQRIFELGEVHTRPGSWHDFFNALAWLVFPRAKAALNARHVRERRAGRSTQTGGRGPVRDAATQFDESGVIVVSVDTALTELISLRRWKELFWERRDEVSRRMRFLAFGHGLCDSLRAPFVGLCGKAAFVVAGDEPIDAPLDALVARVDAEMAARFATSGWYRHPGDFATLPVLGVPGVVPESECAAYYDDRRQFKPLPAK